MDANFDAFGYRWEIEEATFNIDGSWEFAAVESGKGKPPWIDKGDDMNEFKEKRLRFVAAQMDECEANAIEPPAELAREWRDSAWFFTKEKMNKMQEAELDARRVKEAC